MKRKTLFSVLIAILTFVLAFSLLTACGGDKTPDTPSTLNNLSNAYGATIEGGAFPEGATLITTPVDETSEQGKEALTAIKGYDYNTFKTVYIYDISVLKGNAKVQPNGKVKVTIPVDTGLISYRVVFHIKDSGEVEKLSASYQDGKISFETDGFSIFVLAEPAVTNHLHTFSDTWTYDETHHWHAATCEHYAEKSNLGEHTWDDGKITTPATEDKDGVKTYTCTVCCREKTEPVKYHEHTFSGEWSQSETHHWHDCISEDCDAVSDYEEHYYEPHAWWEIEKEATETEEGVMKRICIGCKYEDRHTIPKYDPEHEHTYEEEWASNAGYHWHYATCAHLNEYGDEAEHTWDKGVITKPATDEDGIMTYTCTICGRTREEPIAHVHTFSEAWSKDETHHWHAATCAHTTEVDGKAEHTWNDGVITTPATEEKDGVKTYTCTVCGQTKVEPVKYVAHTHTFSSYWTKDDDYHWHKCIGGGDCTEIADKAEHVWANPSVIRLPSDIEGGLTIYSCTCGAKNYVTTPHEHEYYSDWRYTDTEHWKVVSCSYSACKGLTSAKTAHDYVDGFCKDCGIKDPSVASEGLKFALQEDGTYFVSGIGTCTDVHLVIPSVHEGAAVTGIANKAFLRNRDLLSVYLPDSVKFVGDSAFAGCYMYSLRLPDEMTDIGEGAFSSNTLYTLTLPTKGLTEIKKQAFAANNSLKSLYIPDNIKVIGAEAFNNCSKVTELRLPETMEALGAKCFAGLGITSVKIPKGIKELPDEIFYGCPLTKVEIPEGVEKIGKGAFSDCQRLTAVTLPESLTSIETQAFYCCYSLKSVTIPSKVTEIKASVFSYCSELTEVILPDGLTAIGENAFYLCQKLTDVTLPSGVTTIDICAFSYTALKSISIPEKVTAIGNAAFSNCKSLTSVTLPSGLLSIGRGAFENCTSLTAISIPDGVTDILDSAFADCENLATVNLPTSLTALSTSAFSHTIITSVVIPDSVTDMGWYVFSSCEKLESVTFGSQSKLKTIGGGAFLGCNSLTSITLPSSVELIEYRAFADCENLTTVVIQSNVKKIEEEVFKGSNNVKLNEYDNAYYLGNSENPYYALIQVKDKTATSCTIHSSAYIIAARAFYQSAITEITIPDSVKIICAEAFKSCSSLKNAYFASIDDWCHVYDAEAKTYYKLTDDRYAYKAYWKSASATSETRVGCLGGYMFREGALSGYTHKSDD